MREAGRWRNLIRNIFGLRTKNLIENIFSAPKMIKYKIVEVRLLLSSKYSISNCIILYIIVYLYLYILYFTKW